jgi:putative toxin-antitoxin system antitoxin component (TIGR02293 family)
MAYNDWQMTTLPAEKMIESVKRGVGYDEFEELRVRLGVSASRLAAVIGVSERTLSRRKQEGRLQPDESDRLYRIVRLYRRAVEVLGERSGALWLTTPKRFLGGKTPLEFADTEIGAYEIDQTLGRIEHGVFV